MKLEFKMFFSMEPKKYRVVREELKDSIKNQIACGNCRRFVYNRLSRAPFCAKHLTPVTWYESCAYFKPIWDKKL